MRRLLLSLVSWLMLEAILLNTAAALLPADSCLPQSSHTSTTFAQSHQDCSDWLFKNTSSVSHELSLQCKRQSKRVLALVHFFTLFSQTQERDGHLRPALTPVFFPTLFFFPRKLSPPSATDEPRS